MVKTATSDKLKETDWAKNIEICELVARDPGYAILGACLCGFWNSFSNPTNSVPLFGKLLGLSGPVVG